MKIRVITAIVAIMVLIPVLLTSNTVAFPIICGFFALMSVFEITGCIDVRKKWCLSISSFIYGVAVSAIVTVYFVMAKESYASIFSMEKLTAAVLALTFAYIFIVCAATMLSLGKIQFSKAAEMITWVFYIIFGFMSIALLRRQTEMGAYLYGLVFIGAWMTDTGAYFVGVLFGKHKLIPEVSPKKTVEGAFGGILGCIIGFVLYGFIIQKVAVLTVNYLMLVLLAVVISIVSQFGDLIASYVKRECGIKDFGFIFPGHGGVLDRFDSIIAVAPAIYFITYLLSDICVIFSR
ncbi:MAG: phosphatidate cytidylyltransferase [Clostridia bacterium]|nr:phosphatidate cytidylyltransferase [Clostridia bacterium]